MTTITPAIKEFFDRYASSRSAQDIDITRCPSYSDMVVRPRSHSVQLEHVALESHGVGVTRRMLQHDSHSPMFAATN
jgi:hypothetical protein